MIHSCALHHALLCWSAQQYPAISTACLLLSADAKALLKRLFFDPKRYDLGRVGRYKIAQKLGEEAVEAVIAAVSEDDPALIGEASDLVFHLSILLAERGLTWDAIAAELTRRHGTSGHAEKASRQ